MGYRTFEDAKSALLKELGKITNPDQMECAIIELREFEWEKRSCSLFMFDLHSHGKDGLVPETDTSGEFVRNEYGDLYSVTAVKTTPQEDANDEPTKEETKMKKFEVGKLYSATGVDGIAVMKVIDRTETAVTFEWFGHTVETEEIGYDSGTECISPALIRFFADNERRPQDIGAIDTRMSVAFDADGPAPETEPAAPQEAANEPEADATEAPDEYTEARELRARAYELRLRAEILNNEGKLHDDFVRYVEKLELQASKAVSRAYVAKNPRLAAVLEKAKAKQAEHDATEQAATETPDEPATDNKEEPKMTLENIYSQTLSNLDANDGDIAGVAVYTDGGDTVEEFEDVRDVINRYGDREVEPIMVDGYPMSMAEPDAHGMIHVALVEKETAGQPAPDAGEPDALEVVRILGETLNLIKDNGGEAEAMKARIALWEQVDEFKRSGVTLNVEYDADGRFAGVTEPKAGMKFDELPESVQVKVKEYLRAYDDCSVTYERGAYRVSVGVGITARYAPDFKVCGRYAAEDIFTPEERVLNYANNFYSYPPEYHGGRDYSMMKAAQERGAKLEYDNAGNIVAAA